MSRPETPTIRGFRSWHAGPDEPSNPRRAKALRDDAPHENARREVPAGDPNALSSKT
jgi:hypothetical protein